MNEPKPHGSPAAGAHRPPVRSRRSRPEEPPRFVARLASGCSILLWLYVGAFFLPMAMSEGSIGGAIVFGLPIAIGVVSGWLARSRDWIAVVTIVTGLLTMVVVGMLARGSIGGFCAVVYTVVALPPSVLAGLLIYGWRHRRGGGRSRRGDASALLFALALPATWQALERRFAPPHAPEQFTFERDIEAPLEAA
ncbi:MAG: hypothetical protein EXS13_11605 [Planctomycetes bacterium]|nr:hypothetical protein [Planctomycetota bacterium]